MCVSLRVKHLGRVRRHRTSYWTDHLSKASYWEMTVRGCEQVIPAAGVGLQPQRLICPGARDWGDWDARAATGQTGCLSAAAGGIYLVHLY